MPFSSGTFSRVHNWVTDKANNIKVRADRMDEEMDGFAAGLSKAMLKDGTQIPTANIPFAGFKATGVGDPVSNQDAATKAYVDSTVAMVLLTTGSVSSAATLDIALTSYSAYRGVRLVLVNWRGATDTANLFLRFSTDGGSNFDAGASDYHWAYSGEDSQANSITIADDADSEIQLADDTGNDTPEGLIAIIDIFGFTSASLWTKAVFSIFYNNSSGDGVGIFGGGARLAAQNTDAIRLLYSTGNISSGTWALYGYR